MRPAKGVHITVPWTRVRNEIAMFVPNPADGRSVFVVPWGDVTYIGTTDDDYDGDIDHPQCTAADVTYLLDVVNRALVDPLTEADVIGTWAGLRPLLAADDDEKTADLSRRHGIRVSGAGVVTITGGKLTTYRAMARDTIDQVDQVLDGKHRRCHTKHLPLTGARGYRPPAPDAAPLDVHLAGRYGTEAAAVRALVASDPTLGEPLVPGLPYVRAEAVYAVRSEMARTLDDVLDRRTRCRMLDRAATAAAAESVARLLAPEWGWDDATALAAVAAYRTDLEHERAATRASRVGHARGLSPSSRSPRPGVGGRMPTASHPHPHRRRPGRALRHIGHRRRGFARPPPEPRGGGHDLHPGLAARPDAHVPDRRRSADRARRCCSRPHAHRSTTPFTCSVAATT